MDKSALLDMIYVLAFLVGGLGMGLAPIIVNRGMKAIREINRQGATIFLIEQNASKALSIAS